MGVQRGTAFGRFAAASKGVAEPSASGSGVAARISKLHGVEKKPVANRVKHMRYPAEKTTKGWLYLICFVYTKKLCGYETLPTNPDSSDWRQVLGSVNITTIFTLLLIFHSLSISSDLNSHLTFVLLRNYAGMKLCPQTRIQVIGGRFWVQWTRLSI